MSTPVALAVTVALLAGNAFFVGAEFAVTSCRRSQLEPLAAALASGDTAYGGGTGAKSVPAGTVVVELANGQVVPRSERPGAETAFGILETDADEDSPSDAVTGYGVLRAGSFWENFLPDATGNPKVLPSAYKTELRAQGGQFIFDQYADSRAS